MLPKVNFSFIILQELFCQVRCHESLNKKANINLNNSISSKAFRSSSQRAVLYYSFYERIKGTKEFVKVNQRSTGHRAFGHKWTTCEYFRILFGDNYQAKCSFFLKYYSATYMTLPINPSTWTTKNKIDRVWRTIVVNCRWPNWMSMSFNEGCKLHVGTISINNCGTTALSYDTLWLCRFW